MKSPAAWIHGAKWSACGASAFSPNACPASKNCPDRVAPGLFPPEVVVQIKALACELPSQHQVPLARWSVPEIARHAVASGLVAKHQRYDRLALAAPRRHPALATPLLDFPAGSGLCRQSRSFVGSL